MKIRIVFVIITKMMGSALQNCMLYNLYLDTIGKRFPHSLDLELLLDSSDPAHNNSIFPIGKGTHSIVYKVNYVYSESNIQPIILKVPNSVRNLRQEIDEINILKTLSSSYPLYIVQYYGCVRATSNDNEHLIMFMEKLDSVTPTTMQDMMPIFLDFINNNPKRQNYTIKDLERPLGALLTVAMGIHSANAHGVIHRDTQKTNILVKQIDELWIGKLSDFGVAARIKLSPRMNKDEWDNYISIVKIKDATKFGGTVISLIYGPKSKLQWRQLKSFDRKNIETGNEPLKDINPEIIYQFGPHHTYADCLSFSDNELTFTCQKKNLKTPADFINLFNYLLYLSIQPNVLIKPTPGLFALALSKIIEMINPASIFLPSQSEKLYQILYKDGATNPFNENNPLMQSNRSVMNLLNIECLKRYVCGIKGSYLSIDEDETNTKWSDDSLLDTNTEL